MIGVDSNVLVRYFVRDDPHQTQAADELLDALSSEKPGWICLIVLVELVWALRFPYRIEHAKIVGTIEALLRARDVVLEQEATVRQALSLFRKSNADFADCLISLSARAAGCTRTVTFDKIAARDAGMELIA
jgi:predicted nucleic-acid-binding protein